jgi:hypothetical protein
MDVSKAAHEGDRRPGAPHLVGAFSAADHNGERGDLFGASEGASSGAFWPTSNATQTAGGGAAADRGGGLSTAIEMHADEVDIITGQKDVQAVSIGLEHGLNICNGTLPPSTPPTISSNLYTIWLLGRPCWRGCLTRMDGVLAGAPLISI